MKDENEFIYLRQIVLSGLGTHYVDRIGLELVIDPLPPKCWNYRRVLPVTHSSSFFIFSSVEIRFLCVSLTVLNCLADQAYLELCLPELGLRVCPTMPDSAPSS